nr:hypothetical protein GCM10020093_090860 [Planobispora longispora]
MVPLLPRAHAAVWQSRPYASRQRVRGTVTLRTTVTSTRARGTVIAHLYDVGPLGRGKLITHAPFTFDGERPGRPFPSAWSCSPRPTTSRPPPAGPGRRHRRLALHRAQPGRGRAHLLLPAGNPSYVSIPLRG